MYYIYKNFNATNQRQKFSTKYLADLQLGETAGTAI